MYPVTYEADYAESRNRWTVGFRLILAIPWYIVFGIYAIGAFFVTIIAWFALVFIARYPEWAFNYNSGFVRFSIRVNSWVALQTDEWPPFALAHDPNYPIRIQMTRAERQSRLKAFFRGILAIPTLFMAALMGYLAGIAATISWFTIVFRGYQPRAAHDTITFGYTYLSRAYAYFGAMVYYFPLGGLLTDVYPPVGEERAHLAAAPPPPPPPPSEPPPQPEAGGPA